MNTCILLAGGTGTRMGLDTPKQFIEIDGQPIIGYSLKTIDNAPGIDAVIIVTISEWKGYVEEWIEKLGIRKVRYIVDQGEHRQYSILNGLNKARGFMDDDDIVMIHDSARPLISIKVIKESLATAASEGTALTVTRISDAVYLTEDGRYTEKTLSKSSVFTGQTPVCFNFGLYYGLNKKYENDEIMRSSSSCALLFKDGIKVALVEGDPKTFKITGRDDIDRFKAYLTQTSR